ncbi:gamma-glutamyl-gamma-aminobutyrate hydrolase family protein [soil metagenome]
MLNKHRPRIGVTGPDKGGDAAWFFTALSILLSGGVPKRIRPARPKTQEGLQGLVIGGGADVDPLAYEEENFIDEYLNKTLYDKRKSILQRVISFFQFIIYPLIFLIRRLYSRKSHGLDKDRDKLEFNLVDQAIKHNIPLLGICRGAQLINVYFKGDLYQDLNTYYIEEPNKTSVFPVKKIYLNKNSRLYKILKKDEILVNAIHRQAVKKTGNDIIIVATEANGVVQAIESSLDQFILGVQWHPEYLINRKSHRNIFKVLVKESKFSKKPQEFQER